MKVPNQEKILIEAAKLDKSAFLALSDYYEEEGLLQESAKARAKAGISKVVYKIIEKSTGEVKAEYATAGGCSQWIGKKFDIFEIRMFELRYVDVGCYIPSSYKDLELITHKKIRAKPWVHANHEVDVFVPYIREVNLQEIFTRVGRKPYRGHQEDNVKIENWKAHLIAELEAAGLNAQEIKCAVKYREKFRR